MDDDIKTTPDHDILLTLRADFKAFNRQYTIDVKELKDGTTKTLADHEIRIKQAEQEIHDFKLTVKLYRVTAGVIGGVVFYLLTQFPNILKSWGIMK